MRTESSIANGAGVEWAAEFVITTPTWASGVNPFTTRRASLPKVIGEAWNSRAHPTGKIWLQKILNMFRPHYQFWGTLKYPEPDAEDTKEGPTWPRPSRLGELLLSWITSSLKIRLTMVRKSLLLHICMKYWLHVFFKLNLYAVFLVFSSDNKIAGIRSDR